MVLNTVGSSLIYCITALALAPEYFLWKEITERKKKIGKHILPEIPIQVFLLDLGFTGHIFNQMATYNKGFYPGKVLQAGVLTTQNLL